MTREELKALQQLNEMELSQAETEDFLDFYGQMNLKEDVLRMIPLDGVEVMVHVLPMTNVLREDVRKQDIKREDLLALGSEHTDEYWQVPRLVK